MIWAPSAVSVGLTVAVYAAWHPLPQLAGACAVFAGSAWVLTVAVGATSFGRQWQDGPERPETPGLTRADRAYLEGRRRSLPGRRGQRGAR